MNKRVISIYDLITTSFVYFFMFAFVIVLNIIFYRNLTVEIIGLTFDKYSLPTVFYTLLLTLILGYFMIRKFKLKSFYFDFSNRILLGKGIFFSVIISIFITSFFIVQYIIKEIETPLVQYTLIEYILHALYILVVVSCIEEFLFRSYFQTIFNNVIKNEVFSVIIVGILFSLIHIVALAYTTPFSTVMELFQLRFMNFLSLFCMHCLFYLITKKYNNIIPVVIIHFTWNFVLFILR